MENELQNVNDKSLEFWDKAFVANTPEYEEYLKTVTKDSDWKDLTASEKLADSLAAFVGCKKVMDYGCGEGWGSVGIAKSAQCTVDAVDTAEHGCHLATLVTAAFGVSDKVSVRKIDVDFLDTVQSESYDGIFCSNVIDVLPEEIAGSIIRNFSRITSRGAKIVIGMNHYMEPKENAEKHVTIKNGNNIYVDDVLRMVSRTDQEWTRILSRYFSIDKLEHFAWPGEPEEKRRLFYLSKKD